VTDYEVLDQPAGVGFELEGRLLGCGFLWGSCRGDDTRWPCFLERRQALGWMADRLNRVRVFA